MHYGDLSALLWLQYMHLIVYHPLHSSWAGIYPVAARGMVTASLSYHNDTCEA